MKVCIFAGDYPEEVGGCYTFANQILTALREVQINSKHDFFLFRFCLDPIQPIDRVTLPKPTTLIGNKLLAAARAKGNAFFLPQLRTLLRRSKFFKREYERFKLHALRQEGIHLTLSLSPTCLTTELPFITILWDLEHKRQPYFPEVSLAGEWSDRENHYLSLLQRAAIVITGTETGKAEIQQFYQVPTNRIKVLPFPTPEFSLNRPCAGQKEILAKYSLEENYLFYPAQFWPHKNHVALLFAVKLLRDQYNLNFPVVFAGSDKGNQSYVQKVACELGLAAQVKFLGFVPQADLASLYQNAFALTYMSFFGPDNLPPLEAMALGCPVIASRVTGAEEQMGDAALFFDLPFADKELALAIKSLHDNPCLRQSLIERGKKRAYSWTPTDYVKGLLNILDEMEVIRRCWN